MCVCVFMFRYIWSIFYGIMLRVCMHDEELKVWSLFNSCFISTSKWIWITPFLQEFKLPLRSCNSFYGLLMCVWLCLSVFIKNWWIWEFLPIFHISLNTSRCNQLNLSPLKNKRTCSYYENNGKGMAGHNDVCEKQCYHWGRVTQKADRKRCIPIDYLRPPLTPELPWVAFVQHES